VFGTGRRARERNRRRTRWLLEEQHLGVPEPGAPPIVSRPPAVPPRPQGAQNGGRRPPRGGLVDRLARGSAWTLTTRLAAMLSIFLTTTLAARVLHGDNGYSFGIYTLATSIVMTAAIIAHFGLPRTVVRLVAESMARDEPGVAKGTVQRINRLNVGGGIATGGIILFGGGAFLAHHVFKPSSAHGLELVMVMLAAWSATEGIRFTASEAFRGFHDIRSASIYGDAMRSVLMALSFLFIYIFMRHTTLRVAVGVSLAASALTMALAMFFLWRKTSEIRVRVKPVATAAILAIAIPLTLTDLTGMIVTSGDNFIVGVFRSANDVGIYGAASRLSTLLSLPLFVMNGVVAPMIAELWTKGKKKELETFLRGATTLATIPSLAGLLAFVFAGGWIMQVAFGSHRFHRGGIILVILAAGLVIDVAAGSCTFALIMTGHHRLVAIAAGITLVVTIGGEIVGAHLAGMNGIAIASAGATVLQNILLTGFAKQRLGIWTQATFSPRKVLAFLKLRD
jgi:O-antigen/teichoic acid export membrane protein